jgi:hypothetical protein
VIVAVAINLFGLVRQCAYDRQREPSRDELRSFRTFGCHWDPLRIRLLRALQPHVGFRPCFFRLSSMFWQPKGEVVTPLFLNLIAVHFHGFPSL